LIPFIGEYSRRRDCTIAKIEFEESAKRRVFLAV
jgi:hypothetical protein